uniref:Ig-like domain-containing protein n=1 Tax=Lates calcarifer TaxID=8187 RepID=A0A4W6BYL4_LATCA
MINDPRKRIIFTYCSQCLYLLCHKGPLSVYKPVFNPSRLVVKYGDPVSVTCSICQSYQDYYLELVNYMGNHTRNRTTILWEVENMTEWRTLTKCCHINATDYCCCSKLPITVYKPPDNVSFSFRNHSGPLLEGHQYTLQCEVHNVAPVENLIVTFYRGQTALGQLQSNNIEKKPVTEIFTLSFNTKKEDDGVQYWCEAKLELGPEGPQPPPVVTSEKLSATVNSTPAPGTNPSTSSTLIPSFNIIVWYCHPCILGIHSPDCSHLWFPGGGTGYQVLSEQEHPSLTSRIS